MQLKVDFSKTDLDKNVIEDNSLRIDALKGLLKKMLPEKFFEEDCDLEKVKLFLSASLPIIKWTNNSSNSMSILLLGKQRANSASFFYDMVSRYLISQRELNIEYFFSSDFLLKEISSDNFTILEAKVSIDEKDLEIIEKNKRSFEIELRLGIVSDFHAKRIREFKGLTYDRKTAMVQETIGSLMQKRPKDFGKNIFSEMQQFLIMSRDEFKSQRDYHHISRIISILYMIRKLLKQNIDANPDKRHVILKFLKTKLKNQNSEKTVLGILVGINFLKEYEVFEKKHLIKAINNFLPNVKAVENSFFIDKASKNYIQTCYMEIEKENDIDFSFEEIKPLKDELPTFLKGNIEELIHPVFMPRNEEEIVKNIVLLSHQLKYVHDIPQVIISFDKQTSLDLSFNVILLRVLRPNDAPIKDIFRNSKPDFRYFIDRVKKVGIIRRKYLKEANVFRVNLQSSNYLRTDHTLDINKARSDILDELVRLFADVRDYNGGMIYKQNEALKTLKSLLGQIGEKNDSLLEKFFYSLIPQEMNAIVKLDILKNLFLMFVNAIKREQTRIKKHDDFLFKFESKQLYLIIPINDQVKKKIIKESIECINIVSSELISFSLVSHDTSYLGYCYLNESKEKQKMLFDLVQKSLI